MKVIILLAVFISTGACSNSRVIQDEVSELTSLLNKYVDNNTEVTLEENELIIFRQEQIPKRHATINTRDIKRITYQFVDGNPNWPHQISIQCNSEASIKVRLHYINQDKPKLINEISEILDFSNKTAALKALKILTSIKETSNK